MLELVGNPEDRFSSDMAHWSVTHGVRSGIDLMFL